MGIIIVAPYAISKSYPFLICVECVIVIVKVFTIFHCEINENVAVKLPCFPGNRDTFPDGNILPRREDGCNRGICTYLFESHWLEHACHTEDKDFHVSLWLANPDTWSAVLVRIDFSR